MKTFIIAVLSADGFIARNPHHAVTWASREDKAFFQERTTRAGVVVMGSRTYETIGHPLKDRLTIVYSRGKTFEGVEVTQKNPTALLQDLEQKGYREVAICGGSSIYSLFMEAKVVDTLYLTVEPIIFGSGITLFNKQLERALTLQSTKQIGKYTVVLEYEVIKD